MEIRSKEITLVKVDDIKPNPKNRNIHSEEQIKRLAQIIDYQGFRDPLIISNLSGFLNSGHGRLEAAKLIGLTHVPVMYQDFENEDQEYASMVSENSIASWAKLDLSGINADLPDLGPDFDLDLLGIENFSLDPSELGDPPDSEEVYTNKIEVPIYEPKGKKPYIRELCDIEKANNLLAKIEAAQISDDIKAFLRLSAQRHLIFNYENIAEYYAHSSKEVQELMEESALVIIDFDRAIENGFVNMTKELSEAYTNREEDDE